MITVQHALTNGPYKFPEVLIDLLSGTPGSPGPPGPSPDVSASNFAKRFKQVVIHYFYIQVSAYLQQLAHSQQTSGDKGPSSFPEPFQYMQAQVGPIGARGPPGRVLLGL